MMPNEKDKKESFGDSDPSAERKDDASIQLPGRDQGLYSPRIEPSPMLAAEVNSKTTRETPRAKFANRWWLLSAVSALALIALTVSAIYLLARRSSTVDQLVILTVPSGAEIKLDATDYGHSPVKLEQIAAGNYTLTITKDGFEPIVENVTLSRSQPLEYKEYKLRPIAPSDSLSLPVEERIKDYQQKADDRFARGRYAIPYEDSAYYYAQLILSLDSSNQFALEMTERIRKALYQSAQAAAAHGDVGQAQEIYGFLVEYYPHDEEARLSQVRLEAQLSTRRGEVRDLVRKAEEALQAGALVDPPRASAYFYSKQALAIDRLNERAKAIHNEVNEKLTAESQQALDRGDYDAAISIQRQIAQLFPEDRQAQARLHDAVAAQQAESRANDPENKRRRGLDNYRAENYSDAIPDLLSAIFSGRAGPEVIFSLARSYFKTGQLDNAESYFKKVGPSDDDVYRSAIASLGDIAIQRGDSARALERFKEARRLGGSTMYPIGTLDEKIERIEKKQKEKEAEPTPVTISARHQHGGILGGSCSGPLTVDSTGVRYDGGNGEHVFASNLLGVAVRINGDELTLQLQKNSQKFKVSKADAERFREALARYQQTYSPNK